MKLLYELPWGVLSNIQYRQGLLAGSRKRLYLGAFFRARPGLSLAFEAPELGPGFAG